MQEFIMGYMCRIGGVRHSYRILMGKPIGSGSLKE
jgi:hypothetical protein